MRRRWWFWSWDALPTRSYDDAQTSEDIYETGEYNQSVIDATFRHNVRLGWTYLFAVWLVVMVVLMVLLIA